MWPLILERIKDVIKSSKDHDIIVLEAAVLINANWQHHCHEIWVSIIPCHEVKHSLNNTINIIYRCEVISTLMCFTGISIFMPIVF